MLISVITVVYNRSSTITEAIESVARQRYQNFEHLVQDGCSTDGTLARIEESAHPRINVISAPDFGLYDALNRGINRSNGDVVGFLHSDDFFANAEVLTRVSEAFDNPLVDGVYGDLDYVHKQDTSRTLRNWRSGHYNISQLKWGWMPPHPTLFLRKNIYERYGVFDTSFKISADYDAMLRYLKFGQIKLAYVPEVLVKMRVGGESNRSPRSIFRKSSEDLRALRKNNVGGIGTLIAKNLRKFPQFLVKET
jgi:glycosyltransferase involved in cell wall biosynthesis